MDRSFQQDAFSKTLESKHRWSRQMVNQPSGEQYQQQNAVNRLSRVFESQPSINNTLPKPSSPKPTLPSKPPSLRSTAQLEEKTQTHTENEIDQSSLTFKDIRARFQQESNNIPLGKPHYRPPTPLKPSITGPPRIPEKIIVAAKTGPPALPAKPRMQAERGYMNELNRYNSNNLSRQSLLALDTNFKGGFNYSSSSVNTSTVSSPSVVHMPAMVSRTGTGDSSLSLSSQSSASVKKNGWHSIGSFFPANSNTPDEHTTLKNSIQRPSSTITEDILISPQVSGTKATQKSEAKRKNVISELLKTERVYQSDMIVLKEVYYDGSKSATDCFTTLDIRILFSNLLDIVEFEKSFVALLENACEESISDEVDSTSVGTAFREMMKSIDGLYSEYCKRHEDAVIRLQELEVNPQVEYFLADCKEQIQGKTTSWDLGSLLIKPVQRVLKYPLLLREILSLTPADHSDYNELVPAVKEIQEVADNINEIKRRKDIVEKIVGDKKKTEINVVHGINKKITRRAQKLKQATGFAAEPTRDVLFDALHAKFEDEQELVRQLARDIQGWVRHVKIGFDNLQQFACSFESLYSSWGGVRVRSLTGVSDFSKMATYLSTTLSRELDNDINGIVYRRIDDFFKVFENPNQVIQKRAMKIIDYDRVKDLKSKGDVPDKALQESADVYVSINAQLVDELPKFFELTMKYFEIILADLATVQSKFYARLHKEWVKLVEQNLGLQAAISYEAIVSNQVGQMSKMADKINDITILNKHRNRSNSLSSRESQDINSIRSFESSNYNKELPSFSRESSDINSSHTYSARELEYIVMYDFITNEDDQLDCKKGTIIQVDPSISQMEDGWWFATSLDDYKSGWVPINYCKSL